MSPGSLLGCIWFLLPAGVANMAPVLAARLFPAWNTSVDLGCRVRGRRVLGSHKTWRGIVAGVVAAELTFLLQRLLFTQWPRIRELSVFDYVRQPLLLGATLGLGALLGDLVKSVAKRQLGIQPGRSWIPFDQVDWLLGTIAVAWTVLDLPVSFLLETLAAGTVLHVAVNLVGHVLRLRPTWI